MFYSIRFQGKRSSRKWYTVWTQKKILCGWSMGMENWCSFLRFLSHTRRVRFKIPILTIHIYVRYWRNSRFLITPLWSSTRPNTVKHSGFCTVKIRRESSSWVISKVISIEQGMVQMIELSNGLNYFNLSPNVFSQIIKLFVNVISLRTYTKGGFYKPMQ